VHILYSAHVETDSTNFIVDSYFLYMICTINNLV